VKSAVKVIAEALALQRFLPEFVDYAVERTAIFARDSVSYENLFERVVVSWQGRRSEAIVAEVQLSLVRCRAGVYRLFEGKLISDFTGLESGYVEAVTKWQRALWVTELARYVPLRMNELSHSVSQTMLSDSNAARAAVEYYLRHWPTAESLYAAISELRRGATEEQVRRATKLAEWPGVQSYDSDTEVYESAALLLTRYANDLGDEETSLVHRDPLVCRDLMLRIQLIADRIDTALRPVCVTKHGMEHRLQ